MSAHRIDGLNDDGAIDVDVVFDGPSLPILELQIWYGVKEKKMKAFIFLNKEQAAELTRTLQAKLAEM